MLLITFLICFNATVLRNMKDAVVVTSSGAEAIPFIKLWVLLPMAFLLTIIFAKLSNRFSQERVFYLMTSGFLLFYTLFAFVLYPLRDTLHPHVTADFFETIFPAGSKGLVSMIRNWTFTGFYVMSELWSTIVLNVLYWGFANEVTRIGEARRFYSVFAIGSTLATIVAGLTSNFFGQGADWNQTQISLILVIVASGMLAMAIFRWMNCYVLNEPTFHDLHSRINSETQEMSAASAKPKKKKLSLRESFSYLSNSKYLICIAILVVSYNLVINLVEVVWKDQVRQLYPSPSDYNTYINNVTSVMGFLSLMTALFMARIINRFGWTGTAMITPVILLITSVGFFSFFLFQDSLAGIVALAGMTPLAIAVFFGSAQNAFSKAAKYSVFDATKEMAFIPLSHECKLKGKAAIDGVGSRLGKSGGSFIHMGLLMIFVTLNNSAPYVGVVLMIAIVFWLFAVKVLGKQFNELVASQETPAPSATQAPLELQPVPAKS